MRIKLVGKQNPAYCFDNVDMTATKGVYLTCLNDALTCKRHFSTLIYPNTSYLEFYTTLQENGAASCVALRTYMNR